MDDKMDTKYKILEAFEDKLKQSVDNQKMQINQINDLKNEAKESSEALQRVQKLLDAEMEKSRSLTDLLTKREIESKVAIETQTIEWREQKTINDQLIQRMNDQINDLKKQVVYLETKCSLTDQSMVGKDTELETYRTVKSSISAQISQLRDRIAELRQDFDGLTKNHNRIKSSIKNEIDMNCDLKKQLDQQNEELVTILAQNNSLETQVSELKLKLNANNALIYEKDLQSLRLNQTNDLQKEEIIELREMLKQSMAECESLTKNLTQNLISFKLVDNIVAEEPIEVIERVDNDVTDEIKDLSQQNEDSYSQNIVNNIN